MNSFSNRIKTFFTTGLGTGFSPIAPGTAGSAATCLVFVALLYMPNMQLLYIRIIMAVIALLSTVGCILLGSHMHERFGEKDPSECTLDEWAGQAIALAVVPLGNLWIHNTIAILFAFAAFRFFDVLKPPPIRNAEKLPGGLGVAADDVLAGIAAASAIQLMRLWI